MSLFTAFILSSTLFLLAGEENKPAPDQKVQTEAELLQSVQNEIGNKWNESLKLKDFYVYSGTTELKSKLKEYKNIARKNYNERPAVFSAAIDYGLVLIDLGELNEAKTVWDRAVVDFRSNPTPKVYKAWNDALRGEYKLAQDGWYPIIQEKFNEKGEVNLATVWLPHHFDAIRGLYLIRDNLPAKEKEEIEKIFATTGGLFSSDPKLAPLLISEDIQAGRIKSAGIRLSKVLGSNPEEPLYITLLGITQLINGYYDDALKLFDKSLENYSSSPTASLMRARALHELKKKSESLVEMEHAIKLDPSLKNANKKKLLTSKSYVTEITPTKEAKVPKGF